MRVLARPHGRHRVGIASGWAYVTFMWPIDRPPQWVDRSQEIAALRVGVEALRHGGGAAVWVEGEPGIGKSSLVVEALAGASELGWDIGWGMADQLAERLPLSVIQDCLQVRLSSPDPRRAHAAGLLRSQRLGLFADGDASVSGVEVLMALADELCAAAPTVMVIDDLQWADDASLLVWHQPAASIDQLRLLLIARAGRIRAGRRCSRCERPWLVAAGRWSRSDRCPKPMWPSW